MCSTCNIQIESLLFHRKIDCRIFCLSGVAHLVMSVSLDGLTFAPVSFRLHELWESGNKCALIGELNQRKTLQS